MRVFTELSNSIFYSKRFIKKKKKQSDNSLATFRSALLSPTLLKHGARGEGAGRGASGVYSPQRQLSSQWQQAWPMARPRHSASDHRSPVIAEGALASVLHGMPLEGHNIRLCSLFLEVFAGGVSCPHTSPAP